MGVVGALWLCRVFLLCIRGLFVVVLAGRWRGVKTRKLIMAGGGHWRGIKPRKPRIITFEFVFLFS